MNQIKTAAVISYASLFLNVVTGLLYTPWVINSIGKENYGLYTLAMSVISLFVFDFGLGQAIQRYVSKYLSENRQDLVDKLLGLVFKLYLIADAVILIALTVIYFFLPSMYQGLTASEMSDFKVVYLIAALFCVISFPFIPLNGIIASYEKFIQLKSCDLIHKIIIVVLMATCLLMGGGLFTLVIVNSVAGIIIILLKLAILGKTRIRAVQWHFWDKTLLRAVFSFSIWVTVIQLAQRCIFNLAPSILAAFANSVSVSILGIAICLEGYTYTFASAINGMFLPRVSRMIANDRREEILKLMIRVGRIQIYVIGLICVGFICTGREFIQAWLGDGYSEVYLCALMIILPSFLQLPQEIGSTTIVAEGKVKHQAYAFLAMAAINLILAFPLSKYFGVQGLCLSIMVAYLVRTFLMDLIFYKELKINVFVFFRDSFLRIIPAIVLATVATFLLIGFIPYEGWLGFVLKAVVCVVIYAACIYLMPMNKEERALILSPLKKIVKK